MVLSPGANDVAMAARFWACSPSVRADGKTKLTKQKERLQELMLISSWLSDASFSDAFSRQLSNKAKLRVHCDSLSNAVEDLAEKIVLGLWHANHLTPLRGNSNASALVQFNATLLALRTLIYNNEHVQAAEDVFNESARTLDRPKHWTKVKQWCKDLHVFVNRCAELAGQSFDEVELNKAKACITLAGQLPTPPGRKSLAQVAAERRESVASALENEDEDGFAPVRSELQSSPIEKPPDAGDSGSETGDEEDNGRTSPTYDMSGAESHVPATSSAQRAPTPPQFYEGFAADGYSECGTDDEATSTPVASASALGKRKAAAPPAPPAATQRNAGDQKRARGLSLSEMDAKHAQLFDTRTALAYSLVAYAQQLHALQSAGPRFEPNLSWASQEVFEIAKEIVAARQPTGSPGQSANGGASSA